jgi:hypothetical protein
MKNSLLADDLKVRRRRVASFPVDAMQGFDPLKMPHVIGHQRIRIDDAKGGDDLAKTCSSFFNR